MKDPITSPSAPDRRSLLVGSLGIGAALASRTVMATSTKQPATFSLPAATDIVAPFRVFVPESQLTDLRHRLTHVRWPDAGTTADWTQGVPLVKAQALVAQWRGRYDWRKVETRLNSLPQFRTRIDGIGIYFIHVRSKHANALPVLLTHGWPGSVLEFLDVIGPLTDPTAYGGRPEDAFDVVIPSLPGYGFSDKPTEAGWGLPRIAKAWGVLMKRLGYERYVAQGGDWGAGVTTWLGKQQPQGLAAIHLNLAILFPPPPAGPSGYGPEEMAAIAQLTKYSTDGNGYASIQGTRPQTLGYALADSPAGQAMWMYEKFQAWSDNHGDPSDAISVEKMLDDISLYWLSDTAASSARLYHESFAKDFARTELSLPVAVSIFKGDQFTPPKVWGDRTYSNLIYWGEVAHGGHFAAWEQPALFADELRKAFTSLRSSLGT